MAKIEIRACKTCKRETLHVWQCDGLDNDPDTDPQFYLLCTGCMNIVNTSDLDKEAARIASNSVISDFTGVQQ